LGVAVSSRNLAKVKELVGKEEEEFVEKRDEEGHTFVHWAALGGYNEMVNFLLEKGAPLNEHSDNDYGPRPIHWACIHGNITTVDLFVERGVPIDTTDLNGCSPLLIAAQYGQSLAISYLLQKGANKFHMDINGDSALHWASFKGQPEVVFILLNAGLNPRQKDSYGQTPLHSASIKGDIQCVEMLMEHGGSVEDKDSNSKTARMLALGRRHKSLVKFMDTRDLSSIWDWKTVVFGPPGRSRAGVIFFMAAIICWAYPMYFIKVVPLTMETEMNAHIAFWVVSVFMWVMFVWSKFSDPGYIKTNREAYEEALKLIGNPSAWGEYDNMNNPVYNLCHTCKAVRPVRAKHCRQCNRCVEVLDHHCPWIDNCIGRKNRVPFTVFLYVLGVNSLFCFYFSWRIVDLEGADFAMYIGLSLYAVFFISGLVMIGFQLYTIIFNLTTNERANYRRYRHFRTANGRYKNPFDRGFMKNCLEYWNVIEQVGVIRRRGNHIV
jgi:hypothetical protein